MLVHTLDGDTDGSVNGVAVDFRPKTMILGR